MSTHTLPRNATEELDLYAAEFAKLVDRYEPSRREAPSAWLRRLPNEAYRYYEEGISTFGAHAQDPIERRGRLYLIHTALLFLWMSWGEDTARERFRRRHDRATRRAASLIILERYRRGGVLAHFETDQWFLQPVGQWRVALISGAVDAALVPDASLRASLQEQTTASCTVKMFSRLRDDGAVPSHEAMPLR